MAVSKNGIQGTFSGKIGSIVGYQLNGQNVIRTVGRRAPSQKFSELELINQGRMRAVSSFLKMIRPFIVFGYQHLAPKGSRVGPFQMAQSYALKNAIKYGEGNKPLIDPEKVLVFRGDLLPPQNVKVSLTDTRVTITWDVQNRMGNNVLIALLYDGHDYRQFREVGSLESIGMDIWDLPWIPKDGRAIYVYVGFHNTLINKLSDSVYGGTI
ncbi:DUF6266 family protein [Sphingobacterium sp. SYP-B4668]|uniref:DUF6266 family protein n=1 Tax=Sphingobacterium sp. SYP-B4668 TaxID=2996035 RepID=UPI0022DE9303|nr:DUF6266 family protein [Sphingobacterium sp. SYP-B4668]